MKNIHCRKAERSDLPQILELQYSAYQSEARLLNNFSIPPLTQTLSELEEEHEKGLVLKAVDENGEIVGSVRGHVGSGTLFIGKLMVRSDLQGQGIGTRLLGEMEKICPQPRYELFTSDKSSKNLKLYERLGYSRFNEKRVAENLTLVFLEKNDPCLASMRATRQTQFPSCER